MGIRILRRYALNFNKSLTVSNGSKIIIEKVYWIYKHVSNTSFKAPYCKIHNVNMYLI